MPLTSWSSGGGQEPNPPSSGPVSCPRPRPPVPPESPPRIGCSRGPTRCPKPRPPAPPVSSPPTGDSPPIGDPVPVPWEPAGGGVSALATPPSRNTPPAATATSRAFGASEFENLVFSTMSLSPVQDKRPFPASFRYTDVICSARCADYFSDTRFSDLNRLSVTSFSPTASSIDRFATVPIIARLASPPQRRRWCRVADQEQVSRIHGYSLRRRCTPSMNRSGLAANEKRSTGFTFGGQLDSVITRDLSVASAQLSASPVNFHLCPSLYAATGSVAIGGPMTQPPDPRGGPALDRAVPTLGSYGWTDPGRGHR